MHPSISRRTLLAMMPAAVVLGWATPSFASCTFRVTSSTFPAG